MKLAKIGVKLCSHFENSHEGLQTIRIFVQKQETRDGPVRGGEIQRLDIAERRKPPSFQDLCRITWLRCERYVRQHKAKTQFRIHLVGEKDGTQFNRQARFTIWPREVLADDLEKEDEGDGTDDDAEEEEEEDDDDDAEEEEEEDDDEEEGEDESPDDDADDDKENWSTNVGPQALVPLEERIEPSGQRHVIPQTINPHFITHVQRDTLQLAHRAYSGPMKENRKLVHEMRSEMSAMVKDLKGMAEMLLTKSLDQQKLMAERHDKQVDYMQTRMMSLENQQIESNKLNYKQYENLQELAKQGWVAFLDAMRMKSEVVDERIEWARFLKEEVAQQPVVAAPQESGAQSLFESATSSPMVMGGLAMLLRKAGNEQGAKLFETLARNASKRSKDDDEEEDEEDDDDGIDTHATERPNGNGHAGAYVGNPSGPVQAPTPFADRIRAFRSSLDAKKLAAVRKILSKPAWASLEAASRAVDDRIAVEAILAMDVELRKDELALLGLTEHLTEGEIEAIMAIVADAKKVGRRAPPRRPGPPSASAE